MILTDLAISINVTNYILYSTHGENQCLGISSFITPPQLPSLFTALHTMSNYDFTTKAEQSLTEAIQLAKDHANAQGKCATPIDRHKIINLNS